MLQPDVQEAEPVARAPTPAQTVEYVSSMLQQLAALVDYERLPSLHAAIVMAHAIADSDHRRAVKRARREADRP